MLTRRGQVIALKHDAPSSRHFSASRVPRLLHLRAAPAALAGPLRPRAANRANLTLSMQLQERAQIREYLDVTGGKRAAPLVGC